MKKLIFICLVGLFVVSCQPVEVTCDCNGTGGTGGLSLIDTNLIGHWKLTNVNNPYYPNQTGVSEWNDGQIDLHFFANGTWHLDLETGNGDANYKDGSYLVHSNNCIDFGTKVFNYTINNGVLTFSAVPGQDYAYLLNHINIIFAPLSRLSQSFYSDYVEVNNLTKQ